MRQPDFQPLETKDFLILAAIMVAILWGCWEAGTILANSSNPSGDQSSIIPDHLTA